MITFSLIIHNPWVKESEDISRDFVEMERPISKNKNFGIQISRWHTAYNFFQLEIGGNLRGSDHAGIGFLLEIWKYMFHIHISDGRHWNYEEGRWQTYEEELQEEKEWEEYRSTKQD